MHINMTTSHQEEFQAPLRSLNAYPILLNIIFKIYFGSHIPRISFHSMFQEDYIRHLTEKHQEGSYITGNLHASNQMLNATKKRLGPAFQGGRPLSFQLSRSASVSNALKTIKRPFSVSQIEKNTIDHRRLSLDLTSTPYLIYESRSSFHDLMNEVSTHFILPPQLETPVKKLIIVLKKYLKKRSTKKPIHKLRSSKIEPPVIGETSHTYDYVGSEFHMRSEDKRTLDAILEQYRLRNIPLPKAKYEKLVSDYKENVLPTFFNTETFLENSESLTDFARYCKLNHLEITKQFPATKNKFSLFFTVAMRKWLVLPISERNVNSWMYSKPERSFASRDELKRFNAEWIGNLTLVNENTTLDLDSSEYLDNIGLDDIDIDYDSIKLDVVDMSFDLPLPHDEVYEVNSPVRVNKINGSKSSAFQGGGSARNFSTSSNANTDPDYDDYDPDATFTSDGDQAFHNQDESFDPMFITSNQDNDNDRNKRFVSYSSNFEGDTRFEEEEEEADGSSDDMFDSMVNLARYDKDSSSSPITSVGTLDEDSGVDTDDIRQSADEESIMGITDSDEVLEETNETNEKDTLIEDQEINLKEVDQQCLPSELKDSVDKVLKKSGRRSSFHKGKNSDNFKTSKVKENLSFEQKRNKFELTSGGIPSFFKRAIVDFDLSKLIYSRKVTKLKSKIDSEDDDANLMDEENAREVKLSETGEKVTKETSETLSKIAEAKIQLYLRILVDISKEVEYAHKIVEPKAIWQRLSGDSSSQGWLNVSVSERRLLYAAFKRNYRDIIDNFDNGKYSRLIIEMVARICLKFKDHDLDIVKEYVSRL